MEINQAIHSSGNLHILKPRKALNKAFLKVKPNRSQIESFKHNLIELLDRTNDTESEEFIQIINDDTTFNICDGESDCKIEVLKAKEKFGDESATRKFHVWFKINKVSSDNCSTDTSFMIKNALILAQFIQL